MKKYIVIYSLAFVMLLAACADKEYDVEETQNNSSNAGVKTSAPVSEETEKLEVTMYNQDKEKIGTTTIRPVYTGVKITLEATDLPPGMHGFHIHEKASVKHRILNHQADISTRLVANMASNIRRARMPVICKI